MKTRAELLRIAKSVQLNAVDRAVNFFDPVKGRARYQARLSMALTGGYVGGRKDRRQTSAWATSEGDANADTLPDLPVLRARSRDLVRNNPLATGAINTKVTNIVGMGLKLRPRVNRDFLEMTDDQADEWERTVSFEFELWASKAENVDAEGVSTFYDLQDLALRAQLESGDAFALLPFIRRPGTLYGTKVQLIEADMVSNPEYKNDTQELAGGVQRDAFGAPVGYHFAEVHPGALNRKTNKWRYVKAYGASGRRNVVHLFRKLRPGQVRGVPDLAPVIEAMKQLGNYTTAELEAAVISGLFTVFVKSSGGGGIPGMMSATGAVDTSRPGEVKLGPGAIIDLGQDEDISTANPGRPNQAFDPFVQAILRQIGVALELPFEILIKHFTASYTAAQAALLEAWKGFLARRAMLARGFCMPIYELWLMEAVALGRVEAPGFLEDPAIRHAYLGCEWIGPSRGMINPMYEVNADEKYLQLGVKTLDEVTAQTTGGDWMRNHKQRVKEVTLRKEDGLEGTAPAAFGAKPPFGQEQEQEDEEMPPDEMDKQVDPEDEENPEEQEQ